MSTSIDRCKCLPSELRPFEIHVFPIIRQKDLFLNDILLNNKALNPLGLGNRLKINQRSSNPQKASDHKNLGSQVPYLYPKQSKTISTCGSEMSKDNIWVPPIPHGFQGHTGSPAAHLLPQGGHSPGRAVTCWEDLGHSAAERSAVTLHPKIVSACLRNTEY